MTPRLRRGGGCLCLGALLTAAGCPVPIVPLAAQTEAGPEAPAAESRHRLEGRVIDAEGGAPLTGADVFLLPTDADMPSDELSDSVLSTRTARTDTDASGRYVFVDVTPGRHWIHVRRLGYRPVTIEVRVGEEPGPRVSVAMELRPIPLEPLEVSARGETELRSWRGERIAAGRIGAARIRQSRYLTSDSRIVTPSDVREALTLGEADLFRTLQRLPGVSTRDDFSAELWTRGASWGETRVYLDGLPLFNPLHGFGLLSGMSARSVDAAIFHPGVRPLSFPEGGAAVLDLHTRSGQGRDEAEMGLDVSLASAQAWGGGPLGADGDAWALTARRSYADVAASLADEADAPLPYAFSDLHGRLDLDLGGGKRLAVSGLWERDQVRGEIPDILHNTEASWGNVLGRASLTTPVGSYVLRHTVGGTRYRAHVREIEGTADTDFNAPSEDPALHDVHYFTVRSEVGPDEEGDVAWSAGVELTDQASRYEGPDAWPYSRRPPDLGVARWDVNLTRVGLWGRRRWTAGPLSLEAGLRLDAGDATEAGSVEVSGTGLLRYRASPRLALSAGVGRWVQNAQSPASVGPKVERSLESGRLWVLAGPNRAPIHVRMATMGGELWLGDEWLASATAYLRRSTGVVLPDPTPGLLIQRPPLVEGEVAARGIDVSVRRLAGRVTGWAGYSYGDAEAEVLGITVPAPTDRTHSLDLAISTTLSASWRLGLAYAYGTGAPYTRVLDDCDQEGCGPGVILDRPLMRRAPGYSSLDLVFTWSHAFRSWSLGVFLQARNVLNHDNGITYSATTPVCAGGVHVSSYTCSDGSPARFRDDFQTGIPTIPLLGLTVAF